MINRSFLVTLLIGLFLAAIIHIGILLFAPRLSVSDAWEAIALPLEPFVAVPVRAMRPGEVFNDLDESDEATITEVPMRDLDPQFSHAICRFDLNSGPVHIRTDGFEGFWTLNLFSAGGISFFSTNEQVNAGRPPNILVTTPAQVSSLRANNSASLDNLALVETEILDAAVLFRAYRQHQEALPTDMAELQSVFYCSPFQQNPAPEPEEVQPAAAVVEELIQETEVEQAIEAETESAEEPHTD
ncbi:hypothetical protein [Pararhizobium sp. IMCC21322]|uniref:hypothetical protein n=1 Tax=Pararhizobium sp. IMCC21322 TaxID=3067903 RepID=UPI002740E63E|nr:hypothetical protein [Pararhizobium sp. IMCC21322]